MSLQAVEQLLGAAAADVVPPQHRNIPAGQAPAATMHTGTTQTAPVPTRALHQPTTANAGPRAGSSGAAPGSRQDVDVQSSRDAQRIAHSHARVRHAGNSGAWSNAQHTTQLAQPPKHFVPPPRVVAVADRAVAQAKQMQQGAAHVGSGAQRTQASVAWGAAASTAAWGSGSTSALASAALSSLVNGAWGAASSNARTSIPPVHRTRHARQDAPQEDAAPVPPLAVVAAVDAAMAAAAARRASLPPPRNPWAATNGARGSSAREGPALERKSADLDLSGDFPSLAAAAKPASSSSKAGARRASVFAPKSASSSSWGSATVGVEEDEGGDASAPRGRWAEIVGSEARHERSEVRTTSCRWTFRMFST